MKQVLSINRKEYVVEVDPAENDGE